MSKIRQQRTAEQIHYIFTEILRREISDPRLLGITITEVSIDRELEHADIYVNALGEETRQDDVLKALEGAKGYLRRELSRRMRVRKVPQIHFHWDPRLAYAQEVDEILNSLDIPPADEVSGEDE